MYLFEFHIISSRTSRSEDLASLKATFYSLVWKFLFFFFSQFLNFGLVIPNFFRLTLNFQTQNVSEIATAGKVLFLLLPQTFLLKFRKVSASRFQRNRKTQPL